VPARARLEPLARRVEHIELETTPDFFDLFVDGCQFKPVMATRSAASDPTDRRRAA